MRFKNILNELSQLEFSSTETKINPSQSKIENSIINTIKNAIVQSPKLTNMFNKFNDIYDIEVEKTGSTIKITMNPENGEKQSIGTFPMMVVGKYINKPQEMASFLLINYNHSN